MTRTCRALGGDSRCAAWAAAAVEFAAAAIDVADDFADGDLSGSSQSVSRAPNAALTLAWLAQYCVARSSEDLSIAKALRVSTLLSSGAAACCGGQDMDILLEAEAHVSDERALFVSSRKSGSLIAMAAAVGAACATEDSRVIEVAGRFGAHVGIVAQLVNDIAGIPHAGVPGSSDIDRRKKTLPVTYALESARRENIRPLLDWYQHPDPPDGSARTVAETIVELGGLHYAWIVALAHRRVAIRELTSLEALTGHPEVHTLRRLIPPLA